MSASSPWAPTGPVSSLAGGDEPVTLVEGQTFCLSSHAGDIDPGAPTGLFVLDTRVLSRWQLRVDGRPVAPLAATLEDPFAAVFVGTVHPPDGRVDAEIVVFRRRHVGRGMRERLTLRNHSTEPTEVRVELLCDADFADLFDVKEGKRTEPGAHSATVDRGVLTLGQGGGASQRAVLVRADDTATVGPGLVTWVATLAPGGSIELCVQVSVAVGGDEVEPRFHCDGDDHDSVPARQLARWRARLPTIATDSGPLRDAVRQAGEDLGSLRIFDTEHPDDPVLAAGAPWFMTLFGRDALITAWMALIADPSLAGGVLRTLARLQGDDVDPRTEEEPGKILHEVRFATAEGPALARGERYYGTVDATPLFVMLLGELQRWGHTEVTSELLPHADRAIAWIESFGDHDGDGYVEYRRRSTWGLENQGWKDSWDGIRAADGRFPDPPIALCEVQGYVYAAYLARAHLAAEAGDEATRQRCVDRAVRLRHRFNEDFWSDEHGWYVLGIDGTGRQIDALASNVGHCLWTGIVDPDRARMVADRLLGPDCFAGWGVRTLAASMPHYNPVSYHNGSIWPHDNALCASGLVRYGLVEHAHRIIDGQLAVAAASGGRLPELLAGFDRTELDVPARYPTSCSPQAWAAASPLLWLRTLLRLDPWASRRQVFLHPDLPAGIRSLDVRGISIGDHDLHVRVEGDAVDVELERGAPFEVVRRPRPVRSTMLPGPDPEPWWSAPP